MMKNKLSGYSDFVSKQKQQIKELKSLFLGYIELLKDFDGCEKAELDDFYNTEECLREDIISQLNKLKENFLKRNRQGYKIK